MIVTEELLSREWKCFFASGTAYAGRNPYLFAQAGTHQQWSQTAGRNPHLSSTLAWWSGSVTGIAWRRQVEAENLDLSVCLKLTAPRENVGGSIQRYFVGLFGICSGDTCSGDQQSLLAPFCTPHIVRFHLLSTFLLQSLSRLL